MLPLRLKQPQFLQLQLHDDQAQEVKAAIEKAKRMGGDSSEVNANSNGNALAFIVEDFLGRG